MSDTGVAGFGTMEMIIPKEVSYISQSYYVSIGFSVGAAFGASVAAPEREVILIVGDGAFQMTAQEISSMIRRNCKIMIVLLDNDGYTIEKLICLGPFNDIPHWNYHLLPLAFGSKYPGLIVKTFSELDHAFDDFKKMKQHHHQSEDLLQDNFKFIHVIIPSDDVPPALEMAAHDLRGK